MNFIKTQVCSRDDENQEAGRSEEGTSVSENRSRKVGMLQRGPSGISIEVTDHDSAPPSPAMRKSHSSAGLMRHDNALRQSFDHLRRKRIV